MIIYWKEKYSWIGWYYKNLNGVVDRTRSFKNYSLSIYSEQGNLFVGSDQYREWATKVDHDPRRVLRLVDIQKKQNLFWTIPVCEEA